MFVGEKITDAVLKSCPFCGGKARTAYKASRYDSNTGFVYRELEIFCGDCGIPKIGFEVAVLIETTGRVFINTDHMKDAIKAWNGSAERRESDG